MRDPADRPQLPPGLVYVKMSKRYSLLLTGSEFARGKKRWEAWRRTVAETKAVREATGLNAQPGVCENAPAPAPDTPR